ncbi:MAG: precorrin-3B synthase [Rhizobium sp.]
MTGPGLAMPRVDFGRDVLPPSRLVRGACPSMAAPMQTGDGLLVRLRPSAPGLTVSQLRQLALAAARHGNGLIEITARGNLQLRGLSWATMPPLEADIARAGIVPDTGLAIETPPLSGTDPKEIADARALAARLRQAIARLPTPLTLAPKLSIIVDGSARLSLDTVTADIRLMAVSTSDARPQWLVAVGGTRGTAAAVSVGSDESGLNAVVDLLRSLNALGPRARGRDLALALRQDASAGVAGPSRPAGYAALRPSKAHVGIHDLERNGVALGLQPAFGQIHATDLIAFLAVAESHGISEFRTAPDHTLLLLGASPQAMAKVQAAAAKSGFWTDADEPARHIAACSGAGGCASGTYHTKKLAADVVGWVPGLLDGSVVLHLSGCPKGCAHPGESAIAVVGLATGLGIVVRGKASSPPVLFVDENGLRSGLQRLAQLVGITKAAGESVQQCLTRLGSDVISAALRQE